MNEKEASELIEAIEIYLKQLRKSRAIQIHSEQKLVEKIRKIKGLFNGDAA